MDSFLDCELQESTLDSHGTFTVNSRLAIEKMAKFQLPTPTYWLLKIVQAAVNARSDSHKISLGVQSTRITFRPDENWTPTQIEEDLLQPQPSSTPALYHLKQALWSAGFAQEFPFRLKLPQAAYTLVYDKDGLQRVKSSPSDHLLLIVNHPADEAYLKQLYELAYACPIPLTVDRERIDNLISKDPPLSLQIVPAPDFPLALSELTRRFALEQPESGLPLLVSHNPSQKFSQLHWVYDGLIVASQPLSGRPNTLRCDVYLSAQGLQLEASGTRLVKDPEYHERQNWVLLQRPKGLGRIQLIPPPNPVRLHPGGVLATVCVLTTLVSPASLPGVAFITGALLLLASKVSPAATPYHLTTAGLELLKETMSHASDNSANVSA